MRFRHPFLLLLLLAQLGYGEGVPGRYIVELTGDSVVDHLVRQPGRGDVRGTAAAARRTAVREEQERVRQRFDASVEVLDRVDTVGNALLVAVDDAQAARLASIPGVKRVRQARVVKRLLDQAVVVNRITEAWNLIGDNQAGDGIKIAIIDSGVDNTHDGLRGESLQMPGSYPRTNTVSDEAYTNAKVIVARSYVNLLARRDSDPSARDHVGHGTALAMVAAGTRATGSLATIQGVAPRAFIGNYKVFGTPGQNDSATDAAILKAIDDAVSDGMDIINLSLGSDVAPRLEDDTLVQAVERASAAGVLVVAAAGNNGPDYGTISSPATAHSAIAVGATRNDRTFGSSVSVDGIGSVLAFRGNGVAPANPVSGVLKATEEFDQNGLACTELPAGSLAGRVALILRGTCTFETKLNVAQQAGAVAAVVYAAASSPEPISMNVGAATLPAEMISYSNGMLLKQQGQGLAASLTFSIGAVPQSFNQLVDFSAIGPNVDLAIKPDLTAVGSDMYIATQSFDPNGDMYSADGYAVVDGTSFSTPLVAGALALLKSARPGLTPAQYRSLLVNTATGVSDALGNGATIQRTGGGQLQLGAALRATAAAEPALLSLGTCRTAAATLRIYNLGADGETYSISVEPKDGGAAPAPSTASVDVAGGQSGEVQISFDGSGLNAGAYEGIVRIIGATSSAEIRVPYWYAIPGSTLATIPLLATTTTGRRGRTVTDAFQFRVTDAAGVPIAGVQPEVTVVAGEGSVISVVSADADSPGVFSASVRLGALTSLNTYRIHAGDVSMDVSIAGQ